MGYTVAWLEETTDLGRRPVGEHFHPFGETDVPDKRSNASCLGYRRVISVLNLVRRSGLFENEVRLPLGDV